MKHKEREGELKTNMEGRDIYPLLKVDISVQLTYFSCPFFMTTHGDKSS